MNKAKLVELAEEVLTDLDEYLEQELRKELEKKLCARLCKIFDLSYKHLVNFSDTKKNKEKMKKHYESIKPILDKAIDKALARREK